MVRVYFADSLFDPLVKGKQAGVLDVGGLVQGVVPSHPLIVFVVLGLEGQVDWQVGTNICDILPDVNCAVLKVLVYPD